MSLRFSGFICGLALCMAMTLQADAGTITLDPDGGGGSIGPIAVDSLDIFPGNALANNVIFGGGVAVGDTFELLYQAKLANGTLGGGGGFSSNDFTGEITVVAQFPEVITAVGGGGATFGLGAGGPNYVRMYYDTVADSSPLFGTGFDDGTLIFEGTAISNTGNFSSDPANIELFDQFNADNYGGFQTVVGVGGSIIRATVDYFDSTFFTSGLGGLNTLDFAIFQGSNNTPFTNVNPSREFAFAGVTPDLGAVNGISGPDFQFQADSAISFQQQRDHQEVIPEPSSWAIALVLGLGGVGARFRRRKA